MLTSPVFSLRTSTLPFSHPAMSSGTPSLSKSKQSMQFTRFFDFTSAEICFFSFRKNK